MIDDGRAALAYVLALVRARFLWILERKRHQTWRRNPRRRVKHGRRHDWSIAVPGELGVWRDPVWQCSRCGWKRTLNHLGKIVIKRHTDRHYRKRSPWCPGEGTSW